MSVSQAAQNVANRIPTPSAPSVPNGHREGRLSDAEYYARLTNKAKKRKQAETREKYAAPADAGFIHAAAAGAFQTLAVAGVTLMVVVFVVMMIDESIEVDSESEFGSSYDTITSTLGDAFNLAAVALIVLVASVILWYVSGFGDNGDRLR